MKSHSLLCIAQWMEEMKKKNISCMHLSNMHIFRFYLIFLPAWIEQWIPFMQQYTFISDSLSIFLWFPSSLSLSLVCHFVRCACAARLAFISFFAALYLGQFKMRWFSFCSFVFHTIVNQNMKNNAIAFLCICLDTILFVINVAGVITIIIVVVTIMSRFAHCILSDKTSFADWVLFSDFSVKWIWYTAQVAPFL